MRRWWTLFSLLVVSCRPAPVQYDPLAYLAIGVETFEEAERQERAYARNGFTVTERVDGRAFVALGARSPRTGASSVRVITSRGIALGIDSPVHDRPTWRNVALLDTFSGRDIDGDGELELLVRIVDTARVAPCVVVLRVLATGEVFEVPIDVRAFGSRACPEEVVDLEGDGIVELLVGYRPWVVRNAENPTMPVAFTSHVGVFEPAGSDVMHALAAALVPMRIEERNHARASGDARGVVRLSLEIAWLEGKRGLSMDERRTALAEAIRGLVLDEETSELVRLANERFE